VNFLLLQFLGPLFNQHRYSEAFWLIALCPSVGIAIWLILSRGDERTLARRQQI
jgi:hypothetical protein